MRHFISNMQYQTAPCKVGEVRSHQALQTFTQFSVTSLFLSDLLAVFETCRETVEMFSEFIINSHLRPKQCLFQQSSQSVMQRGSLGQQPFNFTMPSLLSHKWKLNLTHTSLCPYTFLSSVPLHGKQEAPDLQITSYFTEL